MYRFHTALLAFCLTAFVNANHDRGVCASLWVTVWGHEGEPCATTYVTSTDTYTLVTPIVTTGSMLPSPPPPVTATTAPPTSPTNPIIGALCSSTNKCPIGQCCSKYGYCGTTSDFCGAGCHPDAGTCWFPSGSLAPPLASEVVSSWPTYTQPPLPPPPVSNTPSATVDVIPSASPTLTPCSPLAEFFVDTNYSGAYYDACGTYGVCQDAPLDFQQIASSMYFASATSYCDLYAGTACTGGLLSISVGSPDQSDFGWFGDQMESFICYNYN